MSDDIKMTIPQIEARMDDIAALVERMAERKEPLNDEDNAKFDGLKNEFRQLNEQLGFAKRAESLEEIRKIRKAMSDPETVVLPGDNRKDLDDDPMGEPRSTDKEWRGRNPFDLSEMRTFGRSQESVTNELRARALSAVEQMTGANQSRRKAMTDIIEKFDDGRGTISKFALATGNPAYMRAWSKLAASSGRAQLNEDEMRAVDEVRAMSLTDNAGGYLVPFQLDPTVIITSDGSYNPIRQAAREVVATGDVWNGVSSAAVSWSWDAEAAEVSDDATTFAQPSINIYKAAGFVPISIEAFQDEANVTQEVGRLLAFGRDTLEATTFATGTGSAQPFGFVKALSTTANVSATTNNSFGLEDVYLLDQSLPARYRMRASWAANRTIYNDIRQFDTSGGAALWERLGADVPPRLLGRPAYEVEGMDGAIATGDDYVLVFGDFDNYVIADRIGMTVEFIPHLFSNTTTRPSGQRGWYAYYRVGADVVNNSAFKLLVV